MEPALIAAIASGGLALLLLIQLLVARRGRRAARARSSALERDLAASRQTAATAHAGEREAVWSLGESSRLLDRSRRERDDAQSLIVELETRIDDLRDRLVRADADLTAARREADEAHAEAARLESTASTDDDATTIRSLRGALRDAEASLEHERADVARLQRAVASGNGPDRAGDDGYRQRLIASEARRRDLEDRLASLLAVRSAEQRSAAERIAGLERLHTQIGERERRIDELETDLKQASESRDDALEEAVRLQVEIVRLKGELGRAVSRIEVLEEHSAALSEARARVAELETSDRDATSIAAVTNEVERLRKSLDAERIRAERLARRSAEAPTDATYAMWDRVVRERVDTAVARQTARLQDQVAHLRIVVAEKEDRLRALSGSNGVEAERLDLPPITTIKGIGGRIAGILVDHGVATVADVAALTDDELNALGPEMPVYPRRAWDDDWRGQARAILERVRDPRPQDEAPSGPPPVTAIKGIGPKIAAILASHGISSVAEVAALTEDEMERLGEFMPVYPRRIVDDDWIGQARSLLQAPAGSSRPLR